MTKKNKNTALANKVNQVAKTDKKLRKKLKKLSNQKQAPMKMAVKRSGQFGPVSSISTAPVAIGNSIRGASKNIQKTPKGVIITGRDFMFAPVGTPAAVTTWCCVGGTPLTPASFADSVISNYQRMYMKFRFKSFVVHYITSSSTSSTGDVLFYYSKDRSSVFLNQTSSQFLPFIFTDQNTVMGPQWVNHSAKFAVTGDWKLTDYGMHDGIEEYADGEVFLLSKTTTTDSPGYVIFDYVIEYAEESFQPRLLTFPIPRIQWQNATFGLTATAVTTKTTGFHGTFLGNDITGAATSSGSLYSVATAGDVYKVILDVSNSTTTTGNNAWTAVTTSNLIAYDFMSTSVATTVGDGFTCYAVFDGTYFTFFSNATAAFAEYSTNVPASSGSTLRYGVTATITYTLNAWFSFIGSLGSTGNKPNF